MKNSLPLKDYKKLLEKAANYDTKWQRRKTKNGQEKGYKGRKRKKATRNDRNEKRYDRAMKNDTQTRQKLTAKGDEQYD